MTIGPSNDSYATPPPSVSEKSAFSDVIDSVRALLPVTAKLIAECTDTRERLIQKLREIAVFDPSRRTLGSLLLPGSAHIIRQTITLERVMLASHSESFYVPRSVCNAAICRCRYHFYRNRPCPKLFHFNHCKTCHRARRFHFYAKNCSGIPLENLKANVVVCAAKIDSFFKMQLELQEILSRFANVLAEENSLCEVRERKEDVEEDVRTILSYRYLQSEFCKCFREYRNPK